MRTESLVKRPRPTVVCVPCRLGKRRCDRLRPSCTRCIKSSLNCFYEGGIETSGDIVSAVVSETSLSPYNVGKENCGLDAKCPTATMISELCHEALHIPLLLWNPDEMFVVAGPTQFLGQPFSAHSFAQRDTFMRVFCSSIHGMTLLDLSRHLNDYSSLDTSQTILTPLPFIEKAIVKLIEIGSANRIEAPLVSPFSNACSADEEGLAIVFRSLVPEIEDLLGPKKDCDQLLRNFYQNIFPFYPFMDVCAFEMEIKGFLIDDNTTRYRMNTSARDIRKRIETLSLLLIVLAMSMRQSGLDPKLLLAIRKNTHEKAQRLSLLSHRLLCLLDVSRYPNEMTFTCLLYFVIAEHLNPDDRDTVMMHTKLLSIKHVTDLATTLGLQHDPSKFDRVKDPQIIRRKRLLWLGVQSLRYQLSLTEGVWDYENNWFLKSYESSLNTVNGWDDDTADCMGEFTRSFRTIFQDKYEFHKLLSTLMSKCAPIHGRPKLSSILEGLLRVEEFLSQVFPIKSMTNLSNCGSLNFARGSILDIDKIKNFEILLANIIGRTSTLNVWDTLSIHFEKKCKSDWEENVPAYHCFTLRAFDDYLQLATIISEYFSSRPDRKIAVEYGYAIEKEICFAIMRLCSFQTRILLRLSFKSEAVKARGEDEINIIQKLTRYIRNQLAQMIDFVSGRFEESYLCTFQVALLLKYIAYATDADSLVSVTKIFWEQASASGKVPKHIEEKISVKWGVASSNWNVIERELRSPYALQSFNKELLKKIENAIHASPYGKACETFAHQNISADYPSLNGDEVLNQFLQENADIFWDLLLNDTDPDSHS
ncbi:LAFE_0D00342g1_1 [Lachancea fermentati]|uniref:LAFE_0D00342g1_1 n=1 Tax=Lachancea fermentati TaxID=4955 RepID=A0A1G4MAT6_LACFM|nr:LAFE_0D00342g1_1 [Lachancea fermentati]